MAKKKEFAKDYKGRSVFLADTDRIDAHPKEVDKLLLAVGKYMGWEGDISHVFVSDQSSIGDFRLAPKEVAAISKKLGVKISPNDLLCKISGRMARGGSHGR